MFPKLKLSSLLGLLVLLVAGLGCSSLLPTSEPKLNTPVPQPTINYLEANLSGKIVFECAENDWDICILSADTGELTIPVQGPNPSIQPDLSSDGNKVVFVETLGETEKSELRVLDIASGQINTIVDGLALNSQPTWSPDNSKVAFVSNAGGNSNLFLVDADGGQLIQLTQSTGDVGAPAWSPDGKWLAYYSSSQPHGANSHIYISSIVDSSRFEMTAKQITSGESEDFAPIWSPDGSKVAFVRSDTLMVSVFAVDWQTNALWKIGGDTLDSFNPGWFKDGPRIFYTTGAGSSNTIAASDWDGNNFGVIINLVRANINFPAISPDGSRIVFVVTHNNEMQLYAVDLSGGNLIKLTSDKTLKGHVEWGN